MDDDAGDSDGETGGGRGRQMGGRGRGRGGRNSAICAVVSEMTWSVSMNTNAFSCAL